MSDVSQPVEADPGDLEEQAAPACVMSFNVNDPSGAGETLSAALAALLATGVELHAAVGEALAFLDQALDAGFRPGMGNVVPDRFFWALPAEGDEEGGDVGTGDGGETAAPKNPRHVH